MEKRTYISLFSSAGIGCFGFKQMGFNCIATNELLKERLNIQKYNDKCKYESGYISGDLSKKETKEQIYSNVELWKTKEQIKDVDIVVATPPCQGMSTANYKKGNELKRNSLVLQAVEIINNVYPKIFVFENVKAFLGSECSDGDCEPQTINDMIQERLGNRYNIFSKVINFKDYGVPSSRPRTIVIGTKKELINLSPLNIFPLPQKTISVRDAISDLASLNYGEIDKTDIYHFYRKYPKYMIEWIDGLQEGESAFKNKDANKRPYKIVHGERVALKGSFMGNKFRRIFWDEPSPCIATRNDQLASQSTIHPKDNRVLSIRELMRLMSIPDDFKWSEITVDNITASEAEQYLRKYELNIRRSIGEAVPTEIMRAIAKNAKEILEYDSFLSGNKTEYDINNFYINSFLVEKQLDTSLRKESGSFYTPQTVVFDLLKNVKIEKDFVKILEPSVGMGAFLPQLLRVIADIARVQIDLFDINGMVLDKLKSALQTLDYNRSNIVFNYYNADFISSNIGKYDLVVGNPPFVKISPDKKKEYATFVNAKLNNLFGFFLDKIINLTEEIAIVIPKIFLMTPEFNNLRKEYENKFNIVSITDYGVNYFKNVFVEIISIHFKKKYKRDIAIENKLTKETFSQKQGYVYHDKHWIIYRNDWFDYFIDTLHLDCFDFFRDRQITNKYLQDKGLVRVLKSKNILDDGKIISIDDYDVYINDYQDFAVSKYVNSDAIIMPNFTYNTRATILPKDTIVNGSIAILKEKEEIDKSQIDLSFYSTPEFRKYYSIVKNNSKFTINIDLNSVYYIGVKKV